MIGDCARADMLTALLADRALTATELAGIAGVTKQTASAHLAKLLDAGLIVVEHQGRITGYTTGIAFFAHTVCRTNGDLQALIGAATGFGGPGFLLPTRNHEVFAWCLANGLRVVSPMTLMTIGLYNEPAGAWMPSVLY